MIANVFKAFLTTKLEAGGSETTIYLDRITTLTGETISTTDFADFSRGILTVNPDGDGVSSYPEYISFTAVSGSTLTGATRGLSALSNSVVAANKRFHPVNTPVILSFGGHNINDLLDYIDAQVGALTLGANVVSTGTAGENLTAGEGVYLKSDGKWWKWDADTTTTLYAVHLGIVQSTTLANATIASGVLTKGLDTHQSGLVAGTEYYASNTAGGVSSSAGTNSKKIGVARSATNLYFDPYYGELPTGAQKAALVGYSAPSGANPFLTQNDAASLVLFPPAQIVTFTANGTWTKDAGLKYIIVEGVGAGATSSGTTSGGGGGYFKKLILASALGATETITVGTTGSPGGNTSFGSFCTGNGGTRQAGGTATGGDINIPGGHGTGSGSGGTGGNYGMGGDSVLGFAATDGIAAVGYGAGAAGANGGSANPNGTNGVVIVTEFYT